MSDVLTLILALTTAGCLGAVYLGFELAKANLRLNRASARIIILATHLNETQSALQTALGGGWQLADPNKDVFLLPEAAVREFSDTLTGGSRERYRRDASVTILADDDLLKRVMNADRLGIPISFRGLEWRLTELMSPQVRGPFSHVGEQAEIELRLATYAACQKG